MHMHANERYGGSWLMMCGGTIESTCKMCGKRFMHTSMHVYRGCCSYSCMREMDRQDERPKRQEWTWEKAEKRIAQCREKIAYYRAIADDPATKYKRVKSAQHSCREWLSRLEEAQEMLVLIAKKGEQERESV